MTWQNLALLIPIFAFPIAMEKIGWITYMLNGGFDVFVLIVVAFYWVETRNLTLEEVSGLFDGRVGEQLIGVEEARQKVDEKSVAVLNVKEIQGHGDGLA